MTLDLVIKILLVLSWIPIVILKIKLRSAKLHTDYLKQRVSQELLGKEKPTTLIEDIQTVLLLHNHGKILALKTYDWGMSGEEIHVTYQPRVRS